MPLSEDVLKKLITPNAKALSSPKADEIINEGPIGNLKDFDDSMFLAETYEEPVNMTSNGGYLSESAAAKARAMTDYSSNDFNPNRVRNTRMSSAILEDMVKNPIDTTALNAQLLESAGNGNITENNARLNKMLSGAKRVEQSLGDMPTSSRGQMTEQRQAGVANIDYALIKTIVNEAVENKIGDAATAQGGYLKLIRLSKGKIKIVDDKGNIFSAKLEYEGNVKDKK